MNLPDKKVKLGILLPTRGLLLKGEQPVNMERIFELTETVEKAGLDSVWVGDSLVAKPRMEPLVVLGASVGDRCRCGRGV